MNTAIASKTNHTETKIGHLLARRGVDLLLAVDGGNALIQCQVSSAVATAMLAPLRGKAVGQFRPLSGGLVEIDAAVTLPMAARMLAARDAAFGARQQPH